tara:strand:- start:7929 stop:9203 length:1275 start_codon:yes stop_codon:yes gene_type:complete
MAIRDNLIITFIMIFIVIIIAVIIYFFVRSDAFSNSSGYGLNSRFGKMNSLIPLNMVNKSTDFNLFSLNSQLKYSFLKPASEYINTNTNKGIISKIKKSKNIILFPGLTDVILKQNNTEVWPNNINNLDNRKNVIVSDNNKGHFNTITTIIENAKYKNGTNYNTIIYDFRNLQSNLDNIFKLFLKYLSNSNKTVIIAYDFGCVLANILINKLMLSKNRKILTNIEKYLMIAPTIGGVPMTLRDYLSGLCNQDCLHNKLIEEYESIILSLPCPSIYENPIAIYNNISYKANNMSELLKLAGKPVELYQNLHSLQESSLKIPDFINCIVVTSNQYNTPISYDFTDSFDKPPVRYRPKNNNQLPNSDIQYSGTFEGMQTIGDGVVPFIAIQKLMENNPQCTLELIKDKDHFTILKSYELALIILSNI